MGFSGLLELGNSFRDVQPVRDDPQAADFPTGFGYRHNDRVGVDIQPGYRFQFDRLCSCFIPVL